MRVASGAQPRREGAKAPDAAQVVHSGDALHELRVDIEEAAARRDAGVVHEETDRGMPLEHPSRDVVDLCAVGHVTDLPLATDLAGDPLELVRSASEEHAVPAAFRERACRCLADPRGGSGDHGDSLPGHRRATLSD